MRHRFVAAFLVLAISTLASAERRRAVRHPSPPEEVFLLQEQSTGSVLSADSYCTSGWRIDHNEFLRQFAARFATAEYDFILLFPTKPLCYNYEATQNQNIEGIGACTGCANDLAPNLKAFAVIDLYAPWKSFTDSHNDPQALVPTFLDVVLHEIGHYWLARIHGLEVGDGVHWPNNLDLFTGDSRYVDPMAYYHWIRKDGQEICVNGNDRPSVTAKFSNLSLYLMGLAPPEAVDPIEEHAFASKADDPIYNKYGPDCRSSHQFLFTRTITIRDVVAQNGARKPAYPETQRNFRLAFVILTATDEPVTQEFIDYLKRFKAALPQEWSTATGARSEISFISVLER